MTHVAYFRVGLTGSGTPTETSGWNAIADDLVEAAHAVGTKVHLTVAVFDEATQNSVLGSATHRANAVSALAALVSERGADGVNVDFEEPPTQSERQPVSFVTALKAEVDEVYVDTPAVDWSGAYDYSGLSDASDGLFVMAYDYHWGGDPGPVGPLYGGSPWGIHAMDWTLEDYRTWGAADDKIVLGVPMYGREWPSASDAVPGTATGDATSLTVENAIAKRPATRTALTTPVRRPGPSRRSASYGTTTTPPSRQSSPGASIRAFRASAIGRLGTTVMTRPSGRWLTRVTLIPSERAIPRSPIRAASTRGPWIAANWIAVTLLQQTPAMTLGSTRTRRRAAAAAPCPILAR